MVLHLQGIGEQRTLQLRGIWAPRGSSFGLRQLRIIYLKEERRNIRAIYLRKHLQTVLTDMFEDLEKGIRHSNRKVLNIFIFVRQYLCLVNGDLEWSPCFVRTMANVNN